jgi:probable rRNA maturation factor
LKTFIDIQFEDAIFNKKIKKKEILNWIKTIFNQLNLNEKSCSIFFSNSDTMKKLNHDFRGKNYVTDVLSFSQLEGEKIADSNFIGDVVICVPQAEKQAIEAGHLLCEEINFLILHSVLHLIGYDHETDNGEMEEYEKKVYKKLTGVCIE